MVFAELRSSFVMVVELKAGAAVDPSELVAAAQPDAVRDALAVNAALISHAGHAHGGGDLTSVRDAEYKGHRIVVRTTYEITVDGRPFVVHLTVDNAGRVHYHGLPTRDFASVVGLVQKAIDVFHITKGGSKLSEADQQALTSDLERTLEDIR